MAVTESNESTTKGTLGKVYPASNQPWPTIEEVRNNCVILFLNNKKNSTTRQMRFLTNPNRLLCIDNMEEEGFHIDSRNPSSSMLIFT